MQSVIFGHSPLLPTSSESSKATDKSSSTKQDVSGDFQKLLAGKLPHVPVSAGIIPPIQKSANGNELTHNIALLNNEPEQISDGEKLQQFVSGGKAKSKGTIATQSLGSQAISTQPGMENKKIIQIGGEKDLRAEIEAKVLANRGSIFLNKDQLRNRQQMEKTISDAKLVTPTIVGHAQMKKSVQASNNLLKKSMAPGQYEGNLLQDNIIRMPKALQPQVKAKSVGTSKDIMSQMISGNAPVENDFGKIDMNKVFNPTAATQGGLSHQQDATKIFNGSDIEGAKNLDEVIAKINDYVRYTNIKGQKKMEFTFKHSELGKIDLAIKDSGAKGMEIAIEAASAKAQEFFKENHEGILKSLNQSGLKIADVKVESPASKGSFDSFNMNQGQNKENSFSQQSKEQNDSERRRELWNEAQERHMANTREAA